MSASLSDISAITLFVEDPQRSKQFYQQAFNLPVVYEDAHSVVFKFEQTLINLLILPEAETLIAPGVVASGETGARFQLTLRVSNVDAACAELSSHGVTLLNGPMDRAWGVRTASFTDPDGHI